jgi:hypothetical protein
MVASHYGKNMDWVLGFLSGSVYGIALLAAPIYGIFWLLRRFWPRSPHPGIPTVIAVLLAFLTIPSLPRYSFEAKALENIEQAKHMKLVSTSNWGSLTEPLTLIKTPIGSFRLVGPATGPGVIYDRKQPRNMFISVIAASSKGLHPIFVFRDKAAKAHTRSTVKFPDHLLSEISNLYPKTIIPEVD